MKLNNAITIRLGKIINLVINEYNNAIKRFPPMRSSHEGYAIILEELNELWEEIKTNQSTKGRKRRIEQEAIQLTAMSLRFLHDICDSEKT